MDVHASLNTLDYIVLGIILVSGLFAIMSGFVREMYSLFNWAVSYFVAIHFYTLAEPFVSKYISNHHTVVDVSIFVVFCVSFLILAIIGMTLLPMVVRGGALTMIDRSLGLLFGIIRGVLIVSLAYLVASSILWPDIDKPQEAQNIDQPVIQASGDHKTTKQQLTMAAPHWLMTARTRPMMAAGASMLKGFIPEKVLEKTTDEILEQKDAAQDKMSKEFKTKMEQMNLNAAQTPGER